MFVLNKNVTNKKGEQTKFQNSLSNYSIKEGDGLKLKVLAKMFQMETGNVVLLACGKILLYQLVSPRVKIIN